MVVNNSILLNDPSSVKFRRNSNTLVILGAGVILYGFWSVIKIITYLVLGIPVFDPETMEGVEPEDVQFLMIALAIVLTGDVIVRLVLGLSAIAEGRGKKLRKGYLFFNVWEILFGLYSVTAVIVELLFLHEFGPFLENYIGLFMELTSLAILIEVYIAALSVRRYKSRHIEGLT